MISAYLNIFLWGVLTFLSTLHLSFLGQTVNMISYYELLTVYSFNMYCSKAVYESAEMAYERDGYWGGVIGFS